MSTKYFTKSLFTLACTCPTKLYYSANAEYHNSKQGDSFLKSLKDGGYQVGALARCYYPNGIHVQQLNTELAIVETSELLKKNEVVVFEAAVKFDDCLVRIDVLEKKGNMLRVVEVKAKSIDDPAGEEMTTKSGTLSSDWKKYIMDVAFQK